MSSDCTAKLGADTFLKGKLVQLKGSDKNVHAFLGIPYAQPPVGELRFERPLPISAWTGTRDATEYGPICPQENNLLVQAMVGDFPLPPTDEDCLYLNVWTPRLETQAKLPVMVWIHGGGLSNGFSNFYNGTALADRQGVVYVSINYRIGPFGFLCLGDDSAPGNMGLLDQVEALKWIKSNIKAFGGDPENITLFGESAGGISIGLLMSSQLCSGLFHKVIIESGSMLHPKWAQTQQRATNIAMAIMKNFGFNETSPGEDIIHWLKKKDAKWIAKEFDGVFFVPVVDGYFLIDCPRNLFEKGEYNKVPAIIGFNSHEGALYLALDPEKGKVSSIENAKDKILLAPLYYYSTITHKNTAKVFEAAWNYYIGNETDLEEITKASAALLGANHFTAPSLLAANLNSDHATTYVYNYSHRWSKSPYPEWVKAAHIDEIDMVLGKPFYDEVQENWTEEERRLSDLMMSYWANFARTGNPNGENLPQWPRYDKESKQLIHLQSKPEIHSDHNPKAMEFWNVTVPRMLAEN